MSQLMLMTRISSHPVHPATVHFPIAFFSLAWGLDALYGATTKLQIPYLVRSMGSSLIDLGRASHYLQAAGIITAIPAASSGVQQLIKMYNNGGLYEADGQTMRPKMKIALSHAAMNDLILLASVYSWYLRRDNVGLAPTGFSIMLSAVMLPVLFYSANLGGTLTYNYGVGLNMAKRAKGQ